MTDLSDDNKIPPIALIMGLLGLIPFISPSILLLIPYDPYELGLRAFHMILVTYAALIASFLGGVRWGNALEKPHRHALDFTVSVIPPLVAWLALATPRPYDLVVLIGVFLLLGIGDVGLATCGHSPRWFGKLRVILTVGVTISLLLALFAESGL